MATNLSDLLAELSRDQIKDLLLSILQEPGKALPVTDWSPGSFAPQVVGMEADALEELVGVAMPAIIGGGFVDLADKDWIGLLARSEYNLDQIAATFTVQTITLTCVVGAGPYTINTGDLWVSSPTTGNRYNNSAPPGGLPPGSPATNGTLTSAAPLTLSFRAESPGASFVDPAGTITKLITTLAGVTATNPAPDFSTPVQGANGTGTITPSRTSGGVTPATNAFQIRVDSSGVIGAGAWSYSINGGIAWIASGALPSSFALPGGTTITLANGAGSPAFVAGDVFSFSTPGSAIVAQGRDAETRDQLAARCKSRWPSLSDVPTNDKVQGWAFAAAGTLVNRVRVTPDAIVPGQINVYLAGPTGMVSGATVILVRDYILARLGITEKVAVSSTTDVTIATTGTAFVSAARLLASQQAAQNAWDDYLASTGIADTVKASRLEQIIMDAMAGDPNADVSAIALTTGTPNITLTSNQVAVPATGGGDIAHAIAWTPVT